MEGEANTTAQRELSVKEFTEQIRGQLKEIGRAQLELKRRASMYPAAPIVDGADLNGEVLANITLAFRHTEDAAMRLGKVLQALNGGESVYDNSGVLPQK